MTKDNIKSGFTLAETVICIAILGFLIVAALTTFKHQDLGVKYMLSNVLTSLDRAYYNASVISATSEGNIFSDKLVRSGGKDEGAKKLCLALTKYINTVEFSENTCDETKLISSDAKDTEFTDDKIQFIANNGVRFYTSGIINEDDVPFYIIFADINGEKKPNTVIFKEETKNGKLVRKDPDIFAFAVLPIGRIIPIGISEIEPAYLQTRVIYFDSGNERKYSTVSQPYYVSKAIAWGYYTGADGYISSNSTKGGDYPEEPYTYNDYIRRSIPNSHIFDNNKTYPISPKIINNGIDFDLTDEQAKEQKVVNMHCKIEAFDNCTINIDRYAY